MCRRPGEASGPGEHEPGHRGEADRGPGPGLGPAAQSAQAEVITVKQDAAVTMCYDAGGSTGARWRGPLPATWALWWWAALGTPRPTR